jgi:methylmalonyl-CoA mutase cobalamin-binding domain/chain
MSVMEALHEVVLNGRRAEVEGLVQRGLSEGISPMAIVEEVLRPAMGEVGERFSRGEFYLPDLILAANSMKMATDHLRPLLADQTDLVTQETVVVGTVEGDLHDIGKNLVIALLEGTGYRVVDLGVDAKPEKFVEAVREKNPAVIGFSALLSTTMVNIPKTIGALEDAGLRQGRILAVGGAPVTQRTADEWGVEVYAPDAGSAVKIINEILEKRTGSGA